MLQNVFQFRCPFRKYSPHLVPYSTRINLGLTQIITVTLLIATIIGTCQRVSRSNLKIKPKYYALTLNPRIKFPPKIKFKSDIVTHLYLSRLIALSGDIHPNPGPYGRPIPNITLPHLEMSNPFLPTPSLTAPRLVPQHSTHHKMQA